MEQEENTTGFLDLPKMEMNSPPLSPSDPDDDDNEADDSNGSDGDEGEGAVGIGTGGVVGGPLLKKGPWTPEEDALLRTYVEARGEGNWNQVQKNAGLNRCGKSCRLRWANHLRPELKKGPFDEDEERLIIELHATMGNKWAKMATKLPGRTDNEIKNFWNTRSKRRKKAGLSLYPANLMPRVANQDMDCHSPDGLHSKKRPNDVLQGNSLKIEEIKFDNLDYKKESENIFASLYAPNAPPIDVMNPLKRHASSGNIASEYNVSLTCDQFSYGPEKTLYPTDVSYEMIKDPSTPFGSATASGPTMLDGNFSTSGLEKALYPTDVSYEIIKDPSTPFGSATASGQAILDDNFSTSETVQRPSKMELPSVQNSSSIDHFILYNGPSAPPIEQDVTFNYSSVSALMAAECSIPLNTGMLDSVLQGVHGLEDCTKSQGPIEDMVPPVQHAHPSGLSPSGVGESSPSSVDTFVPFYQDDNYQLYNPDLIFSNKNISPLQGASVEGNYWNEEPPHPNYQQDYGNNVLFAHTHEPPRLSNGDPQPDLVLSPSWYGMSDAHGMLNSINDHQQ